MKFNFQEKTELCQWLGIDNHKLVTFIGRADKFDLLRLKTLEGRDALLASVLAKVDMLHVQPIMSTITNGFISNCDFPGLDLAVDPEVLNFTLAKDIILIRRGVTSRSCDEVKEHYLSQLPYPYRASVKKNKVPNHITCWDEQFAHEMFIAINGSLGSKVCDKFTSTDWWQYNRDQELIQFHSSHGPQVYPRATSWRPVGVTPLVRFYDHINGGKVYPHYDASYIYENSKYRTLMSGILFLSSNNTGAIRFIRDGQDDIPVWKRDHKNGKAMANEDEVFQSFYNEKGSILLFDHKICHDVEAFDGKDGDCTSIRFDVVFEAIS